MKRNVILIVLIAALILGVCGCGASAPAEQPTQPEDTPAVTDENTEPQTDYTQIYRSILDRFYLLISDPDGHDDVVEGCTGAWEVANYMQRDEALRAIGYAICDISGDGIAELLIGDTSEASEYGTQIYAVYSCAEEMPACILEGWARNRFCALENGRFFYTGSGGAAYSAFGTYAIAQDGTELICEDFYFTSPVDDSFEMIGGFHNTSGDWETDTSEYLGEADDAFWQLESGLNAAATTVTLIPFAEYSYSGEVFGTSTVSAQWADEFTFAQEYDAFTADTTETSCGVVFTTDGRVKNFRFLALSVSDADSDGNITFDAEECYAQDVLSQERPLLVNLTFFGDLPSYGISYEDESGATHSFALEISGMDGSLVLWDF